MAKQFRQLQNLHPILPPPTAKFTKPLELGNFVVIFEVGPPALCGGHSSLPIQATERSPFSEGKRGLGGSEDTLWEEGWTRCSKKSGHLALHLLLQPHGFIKWA